ncbi:MAG: hypothetical protein QOJ98_3088 [Acidobacteriota bacterium]|jgi:hypothetical protein|nr:hypothetical protein [Acidobacteriota bacterium]
MKTRAFLFLLLFACHGETSGNSFDRAKLAVAAGEFRQARPLLEEAIATEPDAKRRDEAQLALAKIEWRVFRELDSARARLQKLASTDARVVAARMAADRKDFATARAEAQKALAAATKQREKRVALVAYAHIAVRDPSSTKEELREIVASLRANIAEQGAYLATSRALARAALRAGDGAVALEGIDGYYHVSAFSGPPQAIAAAYGELARLLPFWKGSAQPDVARALADVRMFEEAAMVQPQGELAEYAAALRRIEEAINEHYRQIALGNEDKRAVAKIIARELKRPHAELAKRFGTYVNDGQTSGHYDLHMGHVVVDSTMKVEQYGHSGKVRFVALDGLVSNGYSQWVSDGGSGDGGWGTAKEIYQVRPMYADGALRDWERIHDPVERAEDERTTAEETQRDVERARQNAIQPFAGLVKRLRHQYLSRVAAETKTREAFLARVEAELFHSSIVLHEGRHAIDAASGKKLDSWKLEYRAKLSEIALAASPRSVLQNMLDHPFDASPHGKATEQLSRELVAWMEKNRGAIAGLDKAGALLPQLDKLTDEQMRAAARSLDPFAHL